MQIEVGQILDGKVKGITKFGAFIQLDNNKTGMVHISEVAPTFVKEIKDFLFEDQAVRVKVVSIDAIGRIGLSIKQAMAPVSKTAPVSVDWSKPAANPANFEEMLNRFKSDSDEKISQIKRPAETRRGSYSKKNNRDD